MSTKKEFTIEGVTVKARNYRTAVRRVKGFQRKEFDIEGRTIKRNPEDRKRRLANKKKKTNNNQ